MFYGVGRLNEEQLKAQEEDVELNALKGANKNLLYVECFMYDDPQAMQSKTVAILELPLMS